MLRLAGHPNAAAFRAPWRAARKWASRGRGRAPKACGSIEPCGCVRLRFPGFRLARQKRAENAEKRGRMGPHGTTQPQPPIWNWRRGCLRRLSGSVPVTRLTTCGCIAPCGCVRLCSPDCRLTRQHCCLRLETGPHGAASRHCSASDAAGCTARGRPNSGRQAPTENAIPNWYTLVCRALTRAWTSASCSGVQAMLMVTMGGCVLMCSRPVHWHRHPRERGHRSTRRGWGLPGVLRAQAAGPSRRAGPAAAPPR